MIVLFAEWLNRDDPVDGVDRDVPGIVQFIMDKLGLETGDSDVIKLILETCAVTLAGAAVTLAGVYALWRIWNYLRAGCNNESSTDRAFGLLRRMRHEGFNFAGQFNSQAGGIPTFRDRLRRAPGFSTFFGQPEESEDEDSSMYSSATGSFRPDYAGFEEPVYAPGSRMRSVPTRPDLRDVPIRVPRSEVKAAPAVPVRAPGSEVRAAPMDPLRPPPVVPMPPAAALPPVVPMPPAPALPPVVNPEVIVQPNIEIPMEPTGHELQDPEIAEDGRDQEPDGAAALPRSFAEQIKMGHMKLRSSTRK